MKRIFLFALSIVLLADISVLNSGCANVIPPQGGPRDSIPPVLLKSEPGDSARNFTGNKVSFSFDEFVDVQNVSENLLVSPLPKINPIVDFKLKTVTLKIKDTLEANTTYTFDFGNAIRDFTEGNPVKHFTYTFSTGKYIDSLELHGKVILAETGKPDSTLIIMLHTRADDSAVVKDKPRYIAKVDGKGNFVFKNLPPRNFYIYALKDEGNTKLYLNSKQLFAFADKPVTAATKSEEITLYAWAGKPTLPSAAAALQTLGQGPRNKPQGNAAAEKRLRYQTNLTGNQQDLLGNLVITFESILRSFDSSKIRLYTDSTFKPVTGYKIGKDSSNRKLTLTNQWAENTTYHLVMDKDFAEDSSGKKLLKTDTLTFKTKKLADYGALKIKIKELDITKNPVLIFVANGVVFKSVPMTSTTFSEILFFPGDYELRMLYDDNKNGSWDPGKFFGKHQQPELVKPIERKITVKPGWQNEYEIAL
jgi:Bacterial Ig-like domain